MNIRRVLSACAEDLLREHRYRGGVGDEAFAMACEGNDDKEEEWQKYADEFAAGNAGDLVPMF